MMLSYPVQNKERGFTLMELLVAMLLGGIVLAAITTTFISQQKYYNAQEQTAEMVQGTRAAMDMMSRETRMAGYDSVGVTNGNNCAGGSPGSPGIVTATNTILRFTQDFRGDVGPTTPPDGHCDDSDEDITYSYESGNRRILRNSQLLADNIETFTFNYLKADGSAATTVAEIRQVSISITGETAKPDPNYPSNGGYRTYTLTSLITPPNLAY